MMLTTAAERRLYTRIDTALPVKIFYNDVYVDRCNTVNISVGGILIESAEIAFLENSLVQIQFDLEMPACFNMARTPAIVRRSEYHQVAMAFERLEKSVEEFIIGCSLKTAKIFRETSRRDNYLDG